MQDDNGILDKKCICFEVTKEQYERAVEFTNNYDLEYDLFERNCVDFAEALADELGLDIPETEWFWDISTPGTFYDSLNEVMEHLPSTGIREDGAIIKYGNDMHRIIEERTQRDFPTSGTQHAMTDFTLPEEALEKLAVNPQLQGNQLVMSNVQKSLTFSFASDESVKELEITLPRMLIDASGPKGDLPFTILADGHDIVFKETESTETTRTISVVTPTVFTDITVIGTETISDALPLTNPADVAPITGSTVIPSAPPKKPQCECYYNKDCFFWNVCTDFGKCIVNRGGPDGKIQDGMCRFFLWASVDENNNRMLAAESVDNYLLAYEMASMEGSRQPDSKYIELALDPNISQEGHIAIQNIVNNIMVFTVGPSEYEIDVPHRLGYYNPPSVVIEEFSMEDQLAGLGTIEPIDETTLGALSIVREAVVSEIQNPEKGRFENQMNSLREINYETFARCQFPHPPEHEHEFPFEDGISCLISEMGRMLKKFNDVGAADETVPTPLKQIQHGFSLDDVICKPELTLLKRIDNGYPICVKETSVTKIINWGFADP